MDVHRPGLDEAVPAPDEVEQLLAAEDTPRRADQRREQLELLASRAVLTALEFRPAGLQDDDARVNVG